MNSFVAVVDAESRFRYFSDSASEQQKTVFGVISAAGCSTFYASKTGSIKNTRSDDSRHCLQLALEQSAVHFHMVKGFPMHSAHQ
ncbi:unnamed protein product [Ceratitis capitata]|uniref:(Mediterranean fruit fly) hypothetical protein n=1 Tax=Ceratitis capitata TaxID=7213 RepID=A0A811UHB9_CERCA|nr:unnamed protein product [Ceratitis capitata]